MYIDIHLLSKIVYLFDIDISISIDRIRIMYLVLPSTFQIINTRLASSNDRRTNWR